MGDTRTITCDGCGIDLTYTGNSVDYRLRLTSETKGHPHDGGAVTDMMIYPAIERDQIFCDLRCLRRWVTS